MPVTAMVPVDSTSIRSVGYDAVKRELYVEFVESGDTYVYTGVGPKTIHALVTAESVGGYFNREIRPRYPYRKL